MKKVLLALSGLLLTLSLSYNAQAQGSRTGLGLRLSPDGAGFTGKFFMDRNLAIEAQLNAGGVFGGEGESVAEHGGGRCKRPDQLRLGGSLAPPVGDLRRREEGLEFREGAGPGFGVLGAELAEGA